MWLHCRCIFWLGAVLLVIFARLPKKQVGSIFVWLEGGRLGLLVALKDKTDDLERGVHGGL